jgi:maltose-binding protein MalE
MKKFKSLMALTSLIFIIVLTACNEDETTDDRSYLNDIEGTYTGTLSIDNMKTSYSATANVIITENDQLQIHCYSELLDTTMIMDAYEHNDSVMICATGEAFYHQYGHMGNGHHMMDMRMNQSEWMHHLEDDHMEGDQHYGGFNMQNHSFTYTYKMHDGDYIFNGMKNN